MDKIEELKEKLLEDETDIGTLDDVYALTRDSPEACKSLWDGNELVFVLLQHFTNSFYKLNTDAFSSEDIQKVKKSIDILINVVENNNIGQDFMKIQLDYYIYPFLMVSNNESLKISSLKLFFALLKKQGSEGIYKNELLPLLLKIIDFDEEKCQILALETLQLVFNGDGLDFAVQTLDRFHAIEIVLHSVLKKAISSKNSVVMKCLLGIYIKMCRKNNVKAKLKEKLLESLETMEVLQLCNNNKELEEARFHLLKSFG